jgi:hypothetical protein
MIEEQQTYTKIIDGETERVYKDGILVGTTAGGSEPVPIIEPDVSTYLRGRIAYEEKGITEKTTSLAESKAKLKSLKAALKALEPKKVAQSKPKS